MKTLSYLMIGFLMLIINGYTQASNCIRFNEGLPVMVDDNTELNDIALYENTLTYTYNIKNIDTTAALDAKDMHKREIEQNACEDEMVQHLLNKELDVRFVYKIEEQKILEVNVNKELCRSKDSSSCTLRIEK
jgi:hypothetical protein